MTEKIMRLPQYHPGQRAVLRDLEELELREAWISAGRRWRKTTLCLRPAGLAALKGKKGFWGAPTQKQVSFGWEESKRAFRDVGKIFESYPRHIEFVGGGWIVYDTLDDPENAKGGSYDFCILDEASLIKPAAWYEVLRPILADSHGWAIFIFTPRGLNWTWQEWAKEKPMSKSWQIPTLGCEVVGEELVRRPHPLENPHFSWQEAQDLHRDLPPELFQQEFLAQFIEGAGLVFRNVDACACLAQGERVTSPEPSLVWTSGSIKTTL